MKTKQDVFPKHVVDAYKLIQEAKKKKQTVHLQGGRAYGKTILRDLLIKDIQS